MPKFIIVLKNEKLKTYTVIGWLIIALNFFAFIYLGLTRHEGLRNLALYAASLLVIIFLFRFVSKRETVENDSISLAFSLTIIAWIVLGFYWAAVITFVLFLFEDISRRKLMVLVYDDRIIYPSFPKKIIEWKEVSNMMLKDSILTIDLKNNRIFQNEILSPTSEIDFNEFCEQHIKALNI
jgi:hypothetical protein